MNKAVKPEQLDIVEQLGHLEPTPPQKRKMLIAGAEDFDKKFPPPTAEEAVDDFLAKSGPVMGSGYAFGHRDNDEFDWHDDDSIVLREQPATAIYHNKHGVLVIRQKADWDAEHDTFAFITPENCNVFMDALAKVAREG